MSKVSRKLSTAAILAGAVVGVSATAANASYVLTTVRTTSGAYDSVVLFAQTTGDTGTRVAAADITVGSPSAGANLLMKFVDINGDGIPDVDQQGLNPSLSYTSTAAASTRFNGSFVKIGASMATNWTEAPGYPLPGGTTSVYDVDNDIVVYNPASVWSTVKSFNDVGVFAQGTGPLANGTTTFNSQTIPGIPIANAIVPTGKDVTFTGSIGFDLQDSESPAPLNILNQAAPIPEPGSVSLLLLGGLGVLARRRRNA